MKAFTVGRFAWVLKDPVMFAAPVPASGRQGWWNWEEMQLQATEAATLC